MEILIILAVLYLLLSPLFRRLQAQNKGKQEPPQAPARQEAPRDDHFEAPKKTFPELTEAELVEDGGRRSARPEHLQPDSREMRRDVRFEHESMEKWRRSLKENVQNSAQNIARAQSLRGQEQDGHFSPYKAVEGMMWAEVFGPPRSKRPHPRRGVPPFRN